MAGSGAGGDRDESPMGDFATGGLSGLMRGLRALGETREDIDDLDALRRAEAAVSGVRTPSGAAGGGSIDGGWALIATHDGPGGLIGLQDVARALESEDVTVGWDPYDPSREVAFLPPGQSPRVYSLQVPAAETDRARQILEGEAPDGVAYAWDAATQARTKGVRAPAPEFDTGFGVDEAESPPTPRVADPMLSDNERLQRMASGRGSGIGAAIAVVIAVVAIAASIGWLLGR